MEKSIDTLPTGRSSNVIDFEERKAQMMEASDIREVFGASSEQSLWIGGIAEHGRVIITLDVATLSPDATRAFAKTLLMLADTAEKQAAEEVFDD